ncbi:LacI family DNA-binding transcriptional regulator [Paenibacillus sp. 1011MAR3C5]|uniref:LacI family DNA-binding transcriptional regulator n=1 Tax=Paenibacillus sp. 1011MAR3C5 TaxID=1675787 RepID=UPI0015FFAF6E|nr:LacI family DNA-binding transcriptional regulator [Paenibacillus sp. 1011MAR3C5]
MNKAGGKKATMKDIAKAAQVSVATVSYVLNNVSGQTIPDETRRRVLDAASELNYVPNLAARSLIKRQSGLAGILVNRRHDEQWWERAAFASFIDAMERELTSLGYHVILSSLDANKPNMDIIAERKLDAVFVLGALQNTFHQITRHFPTGVPLVAIDSQIEDPLFYRIQFDYERAALAATEQNSKPCSFLVADRGSMDAAAQLEKLFTLPPSQVLVLETEDQLQPFLAGQTGVGLILNEYVGLLASRWMAPSRYTVLCTAGMPELLHSLSHTSTILFENRKHLAALELMQSLRDDSYSGPTDKCVLIQPLT